MTTARTAQSTTNATALYMALDLGWDTWMVGCTIGLGQAPRQVSVRARDLAGLLTQIAQAKRRFGLSLEYSGTHHLEHQQVLLLLAALATFVLWLLGKAAEATGQHRQYQVNTLRKRAVLSTIFIGFQVIGDPRVTLSKDHIRAAASALRDIIQAPMRDY